MADVTLLRTLTRKSQLRFGENYSMTVADMLIKDPMQIARAYFLLAAITFTEDVLREVFIFDEHRIQKPGKLDWKEAMAAWYACTRRYNDAQKESIGERAYMNLCNKKKADAKHILRRSEYVVRERRSVLAWKNQGHR